MNNNKAKIVPVLADVADIRIGYPFRGKIDFDVAGSIPVIQLRNFATDLSLAPAPLLAVKQLPAADRHALQEGDVLYASKGERNFAFAVPATLRGAIPASYFFVLHARTPEVLPEYLAWYLNQPPAKNFLRSHAVRGTHMPVIPKSIFEQCPITVPPLAIQRAIIKLDELRRAEKHLTEKLDAAKAKLVAMLSLRAADAI